MLVTGATGFIGAALVRRLAAEGRFRVVTTVRREIQCAQGVDSVRSKDVGPETDWREALDCCEVVIHLAARVHQLADDGEDSLAAYRRVNTAGTLNLALQAAAAGVRRFIFLSSIKVNGEATEPDRPFTADDAPAPRDPYARSKAEAEAGLRSLATSSSMEVVVIRPPLVYGPGVKANFLSMTRWLARGVPLPLGGIHENRRTFVALDNLVDLIITCIDHPSAAGHVFLAGDAEDLSTTELMTRTAAAMGVRPRLVRVPGWILSAGATLLGKRDVAARLLGSLQVDTSKTRDVLGWSPSVGVDEGLRQTVRPHARSGTW